MIIVGNLQPLEGLVRFAAPSVNLSNLVRQQVSVIGDHVGQRFVRGRSIPSRVMCKREFETPVAFVRLKLRVAQSGVAVTTQDCHDDLPAVVACAGRLQFCRFARFGIGFVEFSFSQEDAGEIPSRQISERIKFGCLAS